MTKSVPTPLPLERYTGLICDNCDKTVVVVHCRRCLLCCWC